MGIDQGSFAFSIHRYHPSGHCLTQINHLAIRCSEADLKAVSLPERWGPSTTFRWVLIGASQRKQFIGRDGRDSCKNTSSDTSFPLTFR